MDWSKRTLRLDEDAGLVGVVADDDGHLLEGPAVDRRRLDDVVATR